MFPFLLVIFTFLLKQRNDKRFLFLFHFIKKHTKNKLIICRANKTIDYNMERINCKSGFPINQAEDASEEDCELPVELAWLLEHEEKEIQPYKKPVDVINLGFETDKKEVKVGASLAKHVHSELVKLLHEYVDVFAWLYQDIPWLDTSIVEYHLPLKLECPPVKQKLRRTRPGMAFKIREEVKKQFDNGFFAISDYPRWVANIVPVLKKDGKVRMCVDYRDLNKAGPKDDFPLPHIDVLIDSTTQFPVFCFMDGFFEYN